MDKILDFLYDFKEDHEFAFNITMIVVMLSLIGVFITVPIIVSGFMATLGAILLDLCALPTIVKLFKLWTE